MLDSEKLEIKKLEYQSAQAMLCHYDLLNWQIGVALIATVTVLTGLVIQQDFIALLRKEGLISWLMAVAIPVFSFFILSIWRFWFRRHRDLYNFRNETLHRLELELGMFHNLRILQTALPDQGTNKDADPMRETLKKAQLAAGHDADSFTPFFQDLKLSGPAGHVIMDILVYGIPFFQLVFFLLIKYSPL